ncbi:MAG: hypothetical protein IKE28_09840 [Solobacterium sp.]|nr:hypothetical protein [Solobacterium sp.]
MGRNTEHVHLTAEGRIIQRLIRTSCAIANEDLVKEKAGRIAETAQRRYEELLIENAHDSKALRKYTFRRIYPAIVAYETFKSEGIEPEKAVWYIREYFQSFAASSVPHLKQVIRWFGLAKKVPKLFMDFSLKGFGPETGFEFESPETKGNEARFNMVRCP